MPGKVKVKIVSGRNLPIMDRSNLTTDAYVEVKLGSTIYKTDVYRKSLNPVWNSEWFRFEMDDLELQDEPLQIRLMDHDTYSSNDAIGKVYLDLNPLLCNSSRGKDTSGKMISGWIPVYDTMHGIRGEVNLIVKVELFSDLNKFRQSSCGVRFFFTQSVPEGYVAHIMQGFVEELVVNDDPEYQWIDKIRTPRASNEARQTLFSKLSGEVQRRVGLKALELGGNAVIGYKQCFDLEGESGIVVRGIGTAAYLTKQYESQLSPTCGEPFGVSREFAELQGYRSLSKSGRSLRRRGGPARTPRLHRRSFRVPNSADCMSVLKQDNDVDGDGDEIRSKKRNDDDTSAPTHPHNYSCGSETAPTVIMSNKGVAIAKLDTIESLKSFTLYHEDCLKKSLTFSTESVPRASSSTVNKEKFSCDSDSPVKTRINVTTSDPCIESRCVGEGVNVCPSFTTLPLPKQTSRINSISLTLTSAFRSRSVSRLPHSSPSPFRKLVQMECSMHADKSGSRRNSGRDEHSQLPSHNSLKDTTIHSRSRSALSSCITHHRTQSETVTNRTGEKNEVDRSISKSVTELRTGVAVAEENMQLVGLMARGDHFESAGSNLDSNADEYSTSDTSIRYNMYCGETSSRQRPETEFESDTSKDFSKISFLDREYDDLSPVSEREGFLLLKKKRGSRRKDRYSKSSLMKRASTNFSERGYFFGGTGRIREEVVKFFKRTKSSDDNESCCSSTKATTVKKCNKPKSSRYREAKFFFRKRRMTATSDGTGSIALSTTSKNTVKSRSSDQLFRSNSDSHSLGQTSLDSLPSVGSEPIFDPDDENSPQIKKTAATSSERNLHEKVIGTMVPKLEVSEENENILVESCACDIMNIDEKLRQLGVLNICSTTSQGNILQINRSKVIEIIKELGYSTEFPLKLYISSLDALLVYEPDSPPIASSATGTYIADDCDVVRANYDGVDGAASPSIACALSSTAFPAHASSCRLVNDVRGSRAFDIDMLHKPDKCAKGAYRSTQFTAIPANPSLLACKQELSFSKSVSKSSIAEPVSTSSFSTVGSSQILGAGDDSSGVSARESLDSFSGLRKISKRFHNDSWTDDDGEHEYEPISPSLVKKGEKTSMPPCPNNVQIENSSLVSLTNELGHICDENNYVLDEKEESNLLFNSSSAINKTTDDTKLVSDEDILVVSGSISSSCIIEMKKEESYIRSCSSGEIKDYESVGEAESYERCLNIPEKMAVPSNRSPIPEELLCDRSTPTLCNLNQTGNTLTSGISNCSISAVTNNMSSQLGPTPNPSANVIQNNNALHCNNMSNSSSFNTYLGGAVMVVTNNTNSCAITNCNTTSATNMISHTAMTFGGGPLSKKLLASSSEENNTSVVLASHHDGGISANLDDTTKGSLIISSIPHSQTPLPDSCHSQQGHATGVPIPAVQHQHHQNRVLLQHQIGFSQDDKEIPDVDLSCVNVVDKNCAVQIAKTTPKSAAFATSKIVPGILPYGQPQTNMTTTIITGGTGTMPLIMGGGGPLHRRSSESDLSTPPKLASSSMHMRGFAGTGGMKPTGFTTTIDQYGLMEYPFITISQFPPGFLTHIGGTVTARSVKLLERISNLDEPESRDAWWNEIRMEIRAHCRAFGCTVVVGYEEHTTMCDDVCVLSASGTAAVAATTIGLKNVELLTVSTKQGATNPVITDAPCPGRGVEKDRTVLSKMDNLINTSTTGNGALKHILVTPSKLRHNSDLDPNCSMLHIPSNPAGLPFPVKMSRCHVCRKSRVPDVLIVTVEVPPGLHVTGKGTLIQAQVFRPKKDCKGEISAKEVSDSLPFLEYELHRRLINKLKVKGMNAIFGLKVQICLGDKLMVALATGTAMYVTALPPPGVPIITAGNLKTDAQKVLQYQKVVQDAYDRNRQHYDLKNIPIPSNGRQSGSSGEESEEDENSDIPTTTKDTYILEVDDAEDIDIISMLIDPQPTSAFLMNNIDYLHGYEEHHVSSQQMFTQVWRCRIPTLSLRQFTAYFERLIRSVCFKLRKLMPCVLSKLSFRVELPEPDEMQISIIGIALGMTDQPKAVLSEKAGSVKSGSNVSVAKEDSELMFPLEEDTTNQNSISVKKIGDSSVSGGDGSNKDLNRGTPPPSGILVPATGQALNPGLVAISRYLPHQPCNVSSGPHSFCGGQQTGNGCNNVKFTVEITPLPYIPGTRIDKYLGNLNFFFIRETTSIRENGGLSGFVHNFVAEVLAIVRAHVAALGGNAMVSYFMTELALLHNPHKNQGQCLINVGGDVVFIANPLPVSEEAQQCS